LGALADVCLTFLREASKAKTKPKKN
jgi:hypothetical protein